MSAKRSPPLWKLPDLRNPENTKAAASSTDSSSTFSSQKYTIASDGHLYRQEAAGGPPEAAQTQDNAIKASGPVINSSKPTCCSFASLRATSIRLQSNEHTWDTLLLRFLRLEPGEVIRSLSKNHVIEVRVSDTTMKGAKLLQLYKDLTNQPHYFAIHLLDEINPPALSSSSPPTSQTKSHARGRYIEIPLSHEFVKRLSLAGSICFWCNEHGLWYEVSIFTGLHEGSWRNVSSARSSPVLG